VIIEYEVVPEDIIAFNIYCNRNLPQFRRMNTIIRLFWIAVALIAFLLVFIAQSRGAVGACVAVELVAVASLAISVIAPDRMIVKTAKKQLAADRYKKNLGKHTLSIDEEAYKVTSEFDEIRRFWYATEYIATSEQYAYIFVDANCAEIIPRRAISDEKNWQAFLQEAMQYQSVAKQRILITNHSEVTLNNRP
jgi:hypothetical protein